MKKIAVLFFVLALFPGCRDKDLRSYWDDVPLLEEKIRDSEDRFATFAELAVKAPEEEALAALDGLFDRLKGNEVAYYVYSDWMSAAFYNPYSPCRNFSLFDKAVNRIVSDGVLTDGDYSRLLQQREWMSYNLAGSRAVVPGVEFVERTLVLVLNLSCPSCREAIRKMDNDPSWRNVRKVAVCCGFGPVPENPGWEITVRPEGVLEIFDIDMSPFYFVVGSDGIVEKTYTVFTDNN